MKNLLLVVFVILFGLSAVFTKAEDERAKARNFFRKHVNTAHPRLDWKQANKIGIPEIPLSDEPAIPIFINANLIVENSVDKLPTQNESSIAVNPVNPMNLISAAVDYRGNSARWVYVSSNGGRSWINKNLGYPYPGWSAANDPSVAFANDGTGYLVYGGFGNVDDTSEAVMFGENGVFMARTTDQGATWESHIPVIVHKGNQTLDSTFEDKYYISVDNSVSSQWNGHLYIPWKRVTPRDSATQIVISKSTDKGSTWSNPVAVSPRLSGTSEDTTYGQSFPLAITGPEGEVYVVWNNGIEHAVGFARSTDGGSTYTEPRLIQRYNIFGITRLLEGQGWRHSVKGKVRAEAYPVIACDITNGPRRGYLYLTWAADNIPNIYFSRSTDRGETWSSPIIVHSDMANDQFWQWISVDPTNGDLAVMYLDSRNDPANLATECYVSYSSDGGDTWIDRRASDVSSDLRRNPFTGNSFAGDYNGNAFYDGIIYPSWVDTRNTTNNVGDNDVYTAVMNTRSPVPPADFNVSVFPDKPDELQLSWTAPTERAFGKSLQASEFKYAIFRNNLFITTLSGQEISFTDKNLEKHQRYAYSIYAVAGNDSSRASTDTAFSGGARKPAKPEMLSAVSNVPRDVRLLVRMPSLREDNTTILTNLKKVNIFRDDVLVTTIDADKRDTGKVIEINDKVPVDGYFIYSASVSDDDPLSNESDRSNRILVYSGETAALLTEDFASTKLPKYYISSMWEVTDIFYYSAPYALTESPSDDYKGNQDNEFWLLPVRNAGMPSMMLEFRHAAIIASRDSGIVEVSRDNGQSWELLSYYDKNSFIEWQDTIRDNKDWKPETIIFPTPVDDTLTIRFRFKSNPLINNDGWYIDDIRLSGSTSVRETAGMVNNVKLYPNPASDRLYLHFNNAWDKNEYKVSVFSLPGVEMPLPGPAVTGAGDIMLDISALPQGVYIARIVSSGVQSESIFSVIK